MATKTKQEIRKEIKRLETARGKEYAKYYARYQKAIDNLFMAEDREEKKHPAKFFEIAKKYQAKIKKQTAQWRKVSDRLHAKYEPKIEKLYVKLRSAQ